MPRRSAGSSMVGMWWISIVLIFSRINKLAYYLEYLLLLFLILRRVRLSRGGVTEKSCRSQIPLMSESLATRWDLEWERKLKEHSVQDV